MRIARFFEGFSIIQLLLVVKLCTNKIQLDSLQFPLFFLGDLQNVTHRVVGLLRQLGKRVYGLNGE